MNTLKAALIFQDYGILQRQKPIRIWGTASPEHQIRVIFGPDLIHGTATADINGSWEVWLPPMEAIADTSLEILDPLSRETLSFSHMAIGEVWIAGGQSNMEFLMRYDEDRYTELHRPPCETIRYFEVLHHAFKGDPMDISHSGCWRICDQKNLEYFSAVGYYFARDLEEALHIPIGIVACNWGGTSALTWMPKEEIQANLRLRPYLQSYQNAIKDLDIEQYESDFLQNRQQMNQLSKSSHDQIKHWISREDQLKLVQKGMLKEYGLVPPLPMGPWHQNAPGRLYESMLLTIAGMAVRGVLWYQGESDTDRGQDYDILFQSVIQSWRELWKEELPWLFVQLAPFYKWLDQDGKGFPLIRQKQELISKTVPGTWMVATTDCGLKWGIHPTRKKQIGQRLCLMARGKVYGEDILCEAPECIKAFQEGSKLLLTFSHAGHGMELHDEIQNDLYVGYDHRKIEIKNPRCQGDCLILSLPPEMGTARYVEFLNVPFGESMLYNSAGIPAKPFVINVGI